jgi:hypothetical protein
MNATDKQAGWVITKVHDDDDQSRIGYGQGVEQAHDTNASFDAVIGRTIFVQTGMKPDDIPSERRVKWRSFSDDGDPAYDGVIDINWLYAPDEWPDEDHDLAYNLDRWNETDWGAVCVFYNAADIRRCRPDLAEHVAKHGRVNPDGERGKFFLSNARFDPQAWIEIYG